MASKKRQVGKVLSEAKLKSKYKGVGLASNICLEESKTLWIPSRVLAINDQLGGGILYGHIMELYGEENVGKTLLAKDFAYVTQYMGGMVLWADAESTFNGPWAEKNGLDLSRIYLLPIENRIEVIADWIADSIVYWRKKLVNNEPILLIIDSIARLETMENLEVAQVDAKAEMGNRAKAIDAMLRRRNHFFHKYGVAVICINQLRKKVGASQFEDPDTTPGGQAMRFYASQRLGLYKGKQIKDNKEKRVGRVVYSRLHKTKISIPKDNIQAEVYFREHEGKLGYSKYFGFIDLLVEKGILIRNKARYYYKEKMIANGEAAMIKLFSQDDKLRAKLIRKSGVLTPSKALTRLQETTQNLYPVIEKELKEDEE